MPETATAKQVIVTDQAAQPIGPYSQAIQAGGFVFVAGEKGIDPRTGKMAEGIQAQTRQTLENIRVILEAAGSSLDEAVEFARAYAPEHLSIMTADPHRVASRIPTAGTTFVGPWASVAFGDYLTGANHVLPTAGRARSFSGLSTQHFLRSYTVQEISEEGARALADDVALLASSEGLPAHGAAALARRIP